MQSCNSQVWNRSIRYLPNCIQYINYLLLLLGHIKKTSWLASSPAHKKGPAQDFFYFYFKKTQLLSSTGSNICVFLLTVVNCVNKLRNYVRK